MVIWYSIINKENYQKYCVKWQKLLRDNIYKRKSVITVNINIPDKRIRVVSQITEKYRDIIHEAAHLLYCKCSLNYSPWWCFKFYFDLPCFNLIMERNAFKIIFIIVKIDIYWSTFVTLLWSLVMLLLSTIEIWYNFSFYMICGMCLILYFFW